MFAEFVTWVLGFPLRIDGQYSAYSTCNFFMPIAAKAHGRLTEGFKAAKINKIKSWVFPPHMGMTTVSETESVHRSLIVALKDSLNPASLSSRSSMWGCFYEGLPLKSVWKLQLV